MSSRILMIETLALLCASMAFSQNETLPQGQIVDCYKMENPTSIVSKMEIVDTYSIVWGIVLNTKKAIDAWEYVDNNDIEGWKAVL